MGGKWRWRSLRRTLTPRTPKPSLPPFLSDATDQQWDDEAVNEVLEQILQQDSEVGNNLEGDRSVPHPDAAPMSVPFHGPNSPISTPTQPDEEEAEEEDKDDDPVVQEAPTDDSYLREMEHTPAGAVSTVQTAQGTTTAGISVVDFNGDMYNLHDHEAAANAVANNWLEVQRVRDSMPSWGEVNQSEPPLYGLHAPSRQNKQPLDGDKSADQRYDNKSIDLLGLDDEDKQDDGGQSGGDRSQSSGEVARSTRRTFKKQQDGLVYRQPDNPTRWSRRSGDSGGLSRVPEQQEPDTNGGGQDAWTAPPAEESGETGPAVPYYNAENRKFR